MEPGRVGWEKPIHVERRPWVPEGEHPAHPREECAFTVCPVILSAHRLHGVCGWPSYALSFQADPTVVSSWAIGLVEAVWAFLLSDLCAKNLWFLLFPPLFLMFTKICLAPQRKIVKIHIFLNQFWHSIIFEIKINKKIFLLSFSLRNAMGVTVYF